jgi:hypothetical protein
LAGPVWRGKEAMRRDERGDREWGRSGDDLGAVVAG